MRSQLLTQIGAGSIAANPVVRQSRKCIRGEMEAVEVVENHHVKRRRDSPALLVATYVRMIGAAIRQAYNGSAYVSRLEGLAS
jgi:hypothetical protein